MLYTTLRDVRKTGFCDRRLKRLLKHLGKTGPDDEPLSFEVILQSNGIDDALWCLAVLPKHYNENVRLLACDFAHEVLNFVPDGEERPKKAIETARLFARGLARQQDLREANLGAKTAALLASREAASFAAWAAANASAEAGRFTASFVALTATWTVARFATWAALRDGEWLADPNKEQIDEARLHAASAEKEKQTRIFLNWLVQQS
ncbi:putative immunity protein [Kiloniella sp. b19]|uniref:putative immunity protein n=1 Tax=Kiloniella sp. GXU_MW_B19 TaxID=3141326 RepID=UPI0031E19BDA